MSGASTEQGGVRFAPEEIDPAQPTRAARLKWVVVVNEALPPGQGANAAACVAAATSAAVPGLLGAEGRDAGGVAHPGLPWAGCSVLAADAATLGVIRARAAAAPGTFVADMPAAAQRTRVYADYLAALSGTAAGDIEYAAVSVIGPRNRVGKIVGRLPLLT